MRLHLACLAALVFAAPALSATPCNGPGHGKLLVQGGGGGDETYTAKGLALCGGTAAKVVVVEYAMGPLDFASKDDIGYATERWVKAGASNVSLLNLGDEPAALSMVREADYIFFDGGDQATLVEWMDKHPAVMAAIRARHAEGALIGGMSAGAAAMPVHMIKGGESASLVDLKSGKTTIVPGLGFWPEVITDQHFVKRQRWARLVSAVLDNPKLPGVAIDEETAVIVDRKAGSFEVIGNGAVTVVDARKAKVASTAKDANWSANGLRMAVLRAGDRYRYR